jgi:signal peptidase I
LKRSHLVREIVETVVLTIVIFLVIHLAIQSYHVSGTSMEPGLIDNEYVMVNKIAYLFHGPERGDVVVFHNPQNPNEDLIKRVIGLPGDTVKTNSTEVRVNDVLLDEKAYISAPTNTPLNPGAKTWLIPPNQYFVLGDNRPVSLDSRYIGPILKDYIVGKAVLVFWPLNKIHFIDTHSNVFSNIKNP